MNDTFYTTSYKHGGWIHSCYSRTLGREVHTPHVHGRILKDCATLGAARASITRAHQEFLREINKPGGMSQALADGRI